MSTATLPPAAPPATPPVVRFIGGTTWSPKPGTTTPVPGRGDESQRIRITNLGAGAAGDGRSL